VTVPYVVGQWVRGERFYGRRRELATLLREVRPVRLVVGMRRSGKTSLLRQLELVSGGGALPVFWDLQGTESSQDLAGSFQDALRDAGDRVAALGIEAPEIAREGVEEAIARLAERARERGQTLLLLADEGEDLLALAGHDPEGVEPVLDALSGRAGVRLVLAGSPRVATLARQTAQGRAWIDAAGEPLVLGGLPGEEAEELLRQTNLPAAGRPDLPDEAVALLVDRCGGHAFLLQLAAKRTLEVGDAGEACVHVAGEPMLRYLLEADLALLEEADRLLLGAFRDLDRRAGEPTEQVVRLERLGLLRRVRDGLLEPGNWFLASWLRS
jgi:hypothetical protein